MTKKTTIRLPNSEHGKDPSDLRYRPDLLREARPRAGLDNLLLLQMTDEQRRKAKEGFWVYKNLLWHSHAAVLCGPANSGKTRIAMHCACEIAEQGFQVIYVNLDVNPADALELEKQAQKYGVKLIVPEFHGVNASEVMEHISAMARSNDDLNDHVIVIDNLKNLVNVINKNELKQTMQLLARTLPTTGATVLILSHTNKYQHDGGQIYEGTNDLRDLATELFYLEVDKHANGQTVEIKCDKDRISGGVEPMTFEIDLDGNVHKLDANIDVKQRQQIKRQKAFDKDVIYSVKRRLERGSCSQTELVKHVADDVGKGKQAVTKALKRYINEPLYWRCEDGPNNSNIYCKW